MAFTLDDYVRTVVASTAHRLAERLHPEDGHYKPTTEAGREVQTLLFIAALALRDVVDHAARFDYLQEHGEEAYRKRYDMSSEERADLREWREPWVTPEEREARHGVYSQRIVDLLAEPSGEQGAAGLGDPL